MWNHLSGVFKVIRQIWRIFGRTHRMLYGLCNSPRREWVWEMYSRCFPQLSFGHFMLYKGAVSTGRRREVGRNVRDDPQAKSEWVTHLSAPYITSEIILKGTWVCVAMKVCKDYIYFELRRNPPIQLSQAEGSLRPTRWIWTSINWFCLVTAIQMMDFSSFKSEASAWPHGSNAHDTQTLNVLGFFSNPTWHRL